MTLSGHRRASAANQEIEIRTLIRLQDMFDVQLLIPAPSDRRWRHPRLTAAYQFVFRYAELQFAVFHIQRDLISVPYQR